MSDVHKAKGNAAFQAGNFDEAIVHFTAGIEADPNNHVLYSNRSAALASKQDFSAALEDAKKVVEIKADWPKGYSRLGAAYSGLREWDESITAYEKGIELDPSNQQMAESLEDSRRAAAGTGGGGPQLFGVDFTARLAMNPQTRPFLSQPDFLAMLRDMSANPQNMTKYMHDPRFQAALNVGMGMSMRSGDQAEEEGFFGEDDHQGHNHAPGESCCGGDDAAHASAPGGASHKASATAAGQASALAPEVDPEEEERKAKAQRKVEALAEKEKGNTAYKKKEFEAAVGHYDRALELFDEDISFLTNRAAVFFEMGEFQKSIADCDAAVERGRSLRADYKMIARALTRMGNCLVKMGDLEEAINIYQKALTEHRNADTLDRLHAAEKTLKQQQEAAYVDMGKCEEERELGNAAFKGARYPEAVKHYTEALKRGPPGANSDAHKLYSNRAACYTKLGAWDAGVKDADECIRLAPDFAKGYSRKGHLQFFMKEFDKALVTYDQGLAHEPANEELREGKQRTLQAVAQMSTGQMSEEERKLRQQKAMQDPEIQLILQDPIMRQVLDDFQNDQAAAQRHLKRPEIMANIQKLVKAGIVQLG